MAQRSVALKIDPGLMASVAKAIDNQRAIVESCFDGICQDAGKLRLSWEGESADAYQSAMDKLASSRNSQSAAASAINALRQYALDLEHIAAGYASVEQRGEARNETLPADVFGK